MNIIEQKLLPKFEKELNLVKEWAHEHLWCYDIETYPNFFSMVAVNLKNLQLYYFELSDWQNDLQALNNFIYYLNYNNAELIGFNNQAFDWPVIDTIFKGIPHITNFEIMKKVSSIFFDERNSHVIWGNNQYIRQIDLYKINHYDNPAKSTSLKMLENNMGMDSIEELPIPPNTRITESQRYIMYLYNVHDVAATILFTAYNIGNIELRRTLTEKFDHDFINSSEAKIGADIFKLKLKQAGFNLNDVTFRNSIVLKECIFNYVNFERPEFDAIHKWLQSRVITETKGVFTDIEVDSDIVKYMNPDLVRIKNLTDDLINTLKPKKNQVIRLSDLPPDTDLTQVTLIAEHLHCVVDGFQYDFGTGGIHGSISSSIVKTNFHSTIVDIDVASFYPNLGIKNRVYPAHLGEPFCDIYNDIYLMRGQYNKKTHPRENLAIKLALNAAYGNSNNVYSFLYDPKYTMTITLNGQLLLCMLAEQLIKVPGLSLVQINTDGMTFTCPNWALDHIGTVCRWWESFTSLELERNDYAAMYIRDVNNYIAVPIKGDPKFKGAYEYKLAENGLWHKDFSKLIVPMGAAAYFLEGISPADFIESHIGKTESIPLFCARSKADKNSKIVMVIDGKDQVTQKITRYYAAINGYELVKVMPPTQVQIEMYRKGEQYVHVDTGKIEVKAKGKKPTSGKYVPLAPEKRIEAPDRRIRVEATCLVAECNKLSKFDWSNVDKKHYIDEIQKLIEPLL